MAPNITQLPAFVTGGDISLLTKMEELGQVYYESSGKPCNLLEIFRSHGCNCLRLRLWVNPTGEDIFVNDVNYTLALAQRIKKAGFYFLLDFHYSDTWADPGTQPKPDAWQALPFGELVDTVRAYSRDVIAALRAVQAMPDIVQIGNEITHGMIWPDGKLGDSTKGFAPLAALLHAGIQGVIEGAGEQKPQIMLHIDRGGDENGTQAFFEGVQAYGIEFDMIGLSFYPFFHGPLSLLVDTLQNTAARYKKPMIVVETGYPYEGVWEQPGMDYALHPMGQKQFMEDLVAAVRAVPDNLGRGVIYWAPEWLEIDGLLSSWSGRTLFDAQGHVLPALDALNQGTGAQHFI